MRTKFTLGVMKESNGTFPDDAALCQWLRNFGWEPREAVAKNNHDEKTEEYRQLAESMFKELPEVVKEEKNDLIFTSWFSSETSFLFTRSSQGELTFRFLHPDLPNLFAGTDRVVRTIHDEIYKKPSLSLRGCLDRLLGRAKIPNISNKVYFIPANSVLLYERDSDRIIMKGRIIRNFLKEAYMINLKDASVSVFSVFLLIVFFVAKTVKAQDIGNIQEQSRITMLSSLATDTLSPAIGAISVALLVGVVGFFITYRRILKSTIISWEEVSGN